MTTGLNSRLDMVEAWQELINNRAFLLFNGARFSDETLAILQECWDYRQLENQKKNNKYAQWFYLTLAVNSLFTEDVNRGIPASLAMELLALAADILDDLADNDNDEVPWRRMAPAIALHAGTCFSMLSYQALTTIDDPRQFKDLASLFCATGSRACDGQIQETIFQNKENMAQEEYLKSIAKKSASLTGCACEAGAITGGASIEDRILISCYGYNIGMMAQIHNDLHDIIDTTGKSDFNQGKKSLPVIYVQNVLQGEPNWDRDGLRRMLTDTGAIHYCNFLCETFTSEALNALEQVNVPTEKKKGLMSIVAP
ncbi:MAG: polyprenyl synthetase family protein [Dehalococcoidia bacterium]